MMGGEIICELTDRPLVSFTVCVAKVFGLASDTRPVDELTAAAVTRICLWRGLPIFYILPARYAVLEALS
jgi:hypothetical protein